MVHGKWKGIPVAWIMVAVAAWGVMLAVGMYLSTGRLAGPLTLVAGVAIYLAIWLACLLGSRRKTTNGEHGPAR